MPTTSTAARDQAVLVVVDEQLRLTAVMDRRDTIVARTVQLVRLAGLLRLPVIATRQYPKGLGESEPELVKALDAAARQGAAVSHVDKLDFDCFGEPEFVRSLEAMPRRQLVIAGMETHICVTQTALSALAAGFDVHVVADACCSREDASHEVGLARLGHAGCVLTTAESVMYETVGRAGTEEFRELLSIVKG